MVETSVYLNHTGELLEKGEWKQAIDYLANLGTDAGGIRYIMDKLNFYPDPEAVEYIDKSVRRRRAEQEALKTLNNVMGKYFQ